MTDTRFDLNAQRAEARRMLDIILATCSDEQAERLFRQLRRPHGRSTDEVRQYRCLRQLCVQYEPLAVALAEAGYPRLDRTGPYEITPEIGRVVQVFNRAVESWIELAADEGPPTRGKFRIVPD